MIKKLGYTVGILLLMKGVANAQDLNDTQAAAGDVYAQAVIDNCVCPDSSDDSAVFERCLTKEERKVLKAAGKLSKYLGADSGDMKDYVEESLASYQGDCESSWDGDDSEEPFPDPAAGERH